MNGPTWASSFSWESVIVGYFGHQGKRPTGRGELRWEAGLNRLVVVVFEVIVSKPGRAVGSGGRPGRICAKSPKGATPQSVLRGCLIVSG
jgi:hypothetical protein